MRDLRGHRYRLFYPVPKARAFGTALGVPVQETGTKWHLQPVPMALFLVVAATREDLAAAAEGRRKAEAWEGRLDRREGDGAIEGSS